MRGAVVERWPAALVAVAAALSISGIGMVLVMPQERPGRGFLVVGTIGLAGLSLSERRREGKSSLARRARPYLGLLSALLFARMASGRGAGETRRNGP